ncbi:hypothetical protein WN943_018525 [Citrus x changshan-huyou]
MSRQRPKRTALPPAQENIDKLEKIVNEGNFYGAQQMYKSISARYVAAQRYSEALDLLHAGACLQLKNNQAVFGPFNTPDYIVIDISKNLTCGAELAVSFVEALVKGKVAYANENLDRVRKIYELFPQIPVPHNLEDDDDLHELTEALGAAKLRVEGCSSFLKAAIKWSIEFGAPKTGSPELHVMLAEYLYSESPELDMARVSFHFVRGNNPEKFASTIVNFMGKCYPGEDDLAVARAILIEFFLDDRYLSLGNMKDANYIMDEVKKQVENKQLQLQPSDLIQFVFYVLQTCLNLEWWCTLVALPSHLLPLLSDLKKLRKMHEVGMELERDALPLFNMLRANYKASIEREPAFNEMLDDIAEKFFGVKRRNPMQGIFGDIFKMM